MIERLLEGALAAGGEGLATVDGGRRRTWAEVHARVAAQAHRLAGRGVGPGDRVALLAPNGAAFLETTFAVAWAGGVLVPLNLRLAARELGGVLDDARPRLLLHAPGEAEAAAGALAAAREAPVPVPLDEAWCATGEASDAPARRELDQPAQLYYTSGTTGRPKGVVLTHGNLWAHARNATQELALCSADRWAHVAPMFHLADAWATLAVTGVGGAHLFLPRFEPAAALRLLQEQRATMTNLVPTMLGDMARAPEAATADLSSLRLLLSGGAPIAPALVAELEALFGCPYAQTYGLTETSPYLTISLLDERHAGLDEQARRAARARTGRPFRGVAVEVVDASGRTVPPDDRTVGEVRARGPTVTPGYWERPEETRTVLRDGWLYTGDLATVDTLGSLRIVDRKQDVILTGGESVYSAEVEAVLCEHPDVAEVAVFGLPDERWGEAVQAALVPRAGAEIDPAALRAFARGRLAGYKLPKAFHLLDALPRTGSGKLSKRLVRELHGRGEGPAPAAAPPG